MRVLSGLSFPLKQRELHCSAASCCGLTCENNLATVVVVFERRKDLIGIKWYHWYSKDFGVRLLTLAAPSPSLYAQRVECNCNGSFIEYRSSESTKW